MTIFDDVEFDWRDKVLRRTSASSATVYTVNQLFSLVQDRIPEPQNMDDDEIMTAETPTAYTVKDEWFLDPGDGSELHKYLTGGAIQTSGYATNVLVLDMDGVTSFVASDKGKTITDDTSDVGPLLAYINGFSGAGTARIWVRDTNTHGTILDNSTIATTGGTGGGAANGDSFSGENIYGNPNTAGIASFAGTPNPQVYAYQNNAPIAEWWARGNVDVLIPVQEGGREIDERFVTFFANQQGDTFSHFRLQLGTAGQQSVVIKTGEDTEDTQGDVYLFYDTGTTATDFTAKELIQEDSGNWEAEVVSVTEWTSGAGTATGVLRLRGYKVLQGGVALADNDTFTGATSGATASCNGTLGDTYVEYGSEVAAFTTLGQTITGDTSGAKRLLRGAQDDGTTGKLNMQVDSTQTGTNRAPQYRGFDNGEGITGSTEGSATTTTASTTITSGYTDITIAHINGFAAHGGTTGAFTPGERVTYSGGEAILIVDTGSQITLGNVSLSDLNGKLVTGDLSGATCTPSEDLQVLNTENFAFPQQSAFPYDVFVQCGSIYEAGRPLSQIYPFIKYWIQENHLNSTYVFRSILRYFTEYDGTVYTDDTADARNLASGTFRPLADASATGDAGHFTCEDEFPDALLINVDTVGTGDYTVTWEYYNGAWTALGNVDDETGNFRTGGTGEKWVRFDRPTDAVITTDGGNLPRGYQIRARISAGTTFTTAPLGLSARALTFQPTNSEEYVTAFPGYAEREASAYGQKLGTTLFGGTGVWYEGLDSGDVNNISLLDSNNAQRAPFPSILIRMQFPSSAVGNGATGFVARDDGSGDPEYPFTSHNTNNSQGDLDFEVNEAIPVDTPTTGVLKVHDDATGLDHRYRYASWSGSVFTLPTKVGPFATTSGSGGRTIKDTGRDVTTLDIEPGDIIRNETDGSWAHVVSIPDSDTIITTKLRGGGDNNWDVADNYSVHSLAEGYTSADTAYAPYLDGISTGQNFDVTVLFAQARTVLAAGRKAGRKPFNNSGIALGSAGVTISAIMPVEPQYNL